MDFPEVQVFQEQSPARLERVDAAALAFDLEMANSFQNSAPVVCMIGLGRVNQEGCLTEIGSITRRADEPALIRWFLSRVADHLAQHPGGRLISFSGTDNDLPWIRERISTHGIGEPESAVLSRVGHLDLKTAFYQRTFNPHISLKGLESLFGIERDSAMQSRKVSYILTDIIRGRGTSQEIPSRIFEYLREDVYHLLVILDRWETVNLDHQRLTDEEYREMVASLARVAKKTAGSLDGSRNKKPDMETFRQFAAQLEQTLAAADRAENFRGFQLPPWPEGRIHHPEVDRIRKKHTRLQEIQLNGSNGDFGLREILGKPKGALAVVRQEGKLLVIRRAEGLSRAPGRWGLPGGVLEKEETPEAAAVRELREELNLEGTAVRPLGTSLSFSGEYRMFWVDVTVEDLSGLTPNPKEVSDVRWVTPQELEELDSLIPGAREQVSRILGKPW
ncbi:MAG: NUDIX domain-containing protein [Deltaproteobacteria bacterium]|nr:NUDIX domain-containing protein [Deltaproteobacteria bacterium]